MTTRLSQTIKLLHKTQTVDLLTAGIGDARATTLANGLRENTTVTSINLYMNTVGAEGALALADALKVNTLLRVIDRRYNMIGFKGASALVDALKVNTTITQLFLDFNGINVNVVMASVDELIARNRRLRRLFLVDARQMLLSVLCADECGAVWSYLLDNDDAVYLAQPSNCFGDFESVRAEFAIVVEKRRRRAAAALLEKTADGNVDASGSPVVKRRRTNR
jgi:hypothetical protein